MAAKKKVELTPPDLQRCQAMVPNGYNFMTLGGRPGRERCKNTPEVIVKELKPGEDGLKGSMSLCNDCLKQFKKQEQSAVAVEPIKERTL